MLFIYNTLSFLLLPLLLVAFGCRRKYRRRLPSRLGWKLRQKLPPTRVGHPTVWIHALSVGEVTSAVPLVRALRTHYPEANLVLSVTTATGKVVADRQLQGVVDQVIDGPIDLLPVVRHFLDIIAPDLYLLVETDFWPNLLHSLSHRGVPALLVNGRISAASMCRYQRGRALFLPMFQCFSALAMQTGNDRDNMRRLGLPEDRLPVLGNLKFASIQQPRDRDTGIGTTLPQGRRLFVAGSTHPGEETVLLRTFIKLQRSWPDLFLVLVPRNPQRAAELAAMVRQQGLSPILRSAPGNGEGEVMIVDTIGELLALYSLATIAFVGGSLVAKGGHNPLEPASQGVPVLFGPHMEDFSEIATLLCDCRGAILVENGTSLAAAVSSLLADTGLRLSMGAQARQVVMAHGDVIDNHLHLIRSLL